MQKRKPRNVESLESRLVLSALSLTYNGQTINNGDTIAIAELGAEDAISFRMVAAEDAQSEDVGQACVHVTQFELPYSMDHDSTPLGCLPAGAGRAVDVVMAEDANGSEDSYEFIVSFENDGVQEQIDFTAVVQDRVQGDTDDDMDVDFSDFLTLQDNFGKEVSDGYKSGDHDNSGTVDFADFLVTSENFGQRLSSERGNPVGEIDPAGRLVPRAWTDIYTINQKSDLVVSAAEGVLSNDANQFGQFIAEFAQNGGGGLGALRAELVEAPVAGTVTFNDDGSFSYDAPDEFIGVAEFTYAPISGLRGVPQTVSITVLSEFQTQSDTARDDSYFTGQDSTLVVNAARGVIKNDNAEADPLKAALFSAPENGTVTLGPNGDFIYVPAPNFVGIDTFEYVANDQFFSSKPATVTIRVV